MDAPGCHGRSAVPLADGGDRCVDPQLRPAKAVALLPEKEARSGVSLWQNREQGRAEGDDMLAAGLVAGRGDCPASIADLVAVHSSHLTPAADREQQRSDESRRDVTRSLALDRGDLARS
jgi:hypothetical protein